MITLLLTPSTYCSLGFAFLVRPWEFRSSIIFWNLVSSYSLQMPKHHNRFPTTTAIMLCWDINNIFHDLHNLILFMFLSSQHRKATPAGGFVMLTTRHTYIDCMFINISFAEVDCRILTINGLLRHIINYIKPLTYIKLTLRGCYSFGKY